MPWDMRQVALETPQGLRGVATVLARSIGQTIQRPTQLTVAGSACGEFCGWAQPISAACVLLA